MSSPSFPSNERLCEMINGSSWADLVALRAQAGVQARAASRDYGGFHIPLPIYPHVLAGISVPDALPRHFKAGRVNNVITGEIAVRELEYL
ncbi:hypothetical protein F4780DRAFT_751007 [Xylariomycetidae sp. FL0641]|nr:hypothetical protein F4780DRAFT_751007 [Xylariomycetidae sp. FL0641]